MRIPPLRFLSIALALTLACGTAAASAKQSKLLISTLFDYSGAIRWSEFERAYDYVDPATRAEHPLTDIDRARYKQVEVTHYEVTAETQTREADDRQVEIRLINRNTQAERTISYHEHWRWDAKDKRWWLTTGLPDITAENETDE
jgi:hypothetical protein